MPLCELRYFSRALGKHIGAFVLLPETESPGPFPVMFLLHGLSDDYSIWLRRTSIERYVEGMNLIVVMPDGGRGFYTDAKEGFAYGTAMVPELSDLVARTFHTRPGWGVTGLSMGGYGAVRLALRHPDVFRSAVSLSGAMGFGHIVGEDNRGREEFMRILGEDFVGGENDLFALVECLDADARPALRIDCGTEDFLIEHNRSFHDHLQSLGVEHEYEESPGAHDWAYWDEHVRPALKFHRRHLEF